MLRNRLTSKQYTCLSHTFPHLAGRDLSPEARLLSFLDSFDLCRFFYDSSYRRRLNAILERFTDEEFENFERTHSHRFTVN